MTQSLEINSAEFQSTVSTATGITFAVASDVDLSFGDVVRPGLTQKPLRSAWPVWKPGIYYESELGMPDLEQERLEALVKSEALLIEALIELTLSDLNAAGDAICQCDLGGWIGNGFPGETKEGLGLRFGAPLGDTPCTVGLYVLNEEEARVVRAAFLGLCPVCKKDNWLESLIDYVRRIRIQSPEEFQRHTNALVLSVRAKVV